jgi:eukaryotic-like serine/threonine-protein kinase
MTMTGLDGIVDDYLHRLDAALLQLPAAERDQIHAEITEHIAQARATLPTQSEAAIRELLDRLGDPEVIAAAALTDAGGEVDPRRPVRPRRGAMLVAIGVVVLALTGVGAYLAQRGTSTLTVPRLVGMQLGEADSALAAAGLKQGGVNVLPSASVPANAVIGTSPAGGATVRPGSEVNFAISQGPTVMPNVIGLDSRAATSDLVGRSLRVVSVRVHGSQAQGTVVAQSPAQDTKLARETWVEIDVINNSQKVPKTVPNVLFMPGSYAISELRSLGFRLHVRYFARPGIHGVVLGQTTPGAPAPSTGVYIAISK